jgi:hypothetical protein
MSNRKIGAINAIIFFVFWLLVLLAGADKPPPLGFIWIILTIAICSAVVYWRVLLDGAVAGLLIAVPFALKGSGEPSITMGPVDYAIWFAVLAVMGIFNSVALYFINALVAGRIARSNTKAPSVVVEE